MRNKKVSKDEINKIRNSSNSKVKFSIKNVILASEILNKSIHQHKKFVDYQKFPDLYRNNMYFRIKNSRNIDSFTAENSNADQTSNAKWYIVPTFSLFL